MGNPLENGMMSDKEIMPTAEKKVDGPLEQLRAALHGKLAKKEDDKNVVEKSAE
jgi:hypothetical protein